MDRKRTAWLVAFVMLAANPASATAENAPEGDDFFEKQIRPLLVEHCLECHGPKKQQGGLRLTSRSSLNWRTLPTSERAVTSRESPVMLQWTCSELRKGAPATGG